MSIQTYSLAADGDENISPHFKVREFRCKDGSDKIFVSTETVLLLEKIRAYYGKPVTIHSGYRTPSYNKKVGGAKNSQHLKGTAADFTVEGIAPLQVWRDIHEGKIFGEHLGGLGRYTTFTHLDTGSRRRWVG